MTTFLEKTADYIFQNYGSETNSLTIILPNRRGSLYLKKYLANHYNKPFWSPKFYSIEDFVNELSDRKPANQIFLINELYKIHIELNPTNYRTFDEFIGVAELMIADFNEIDFFLADIDGIFDFITETKAIELWNLDGKPLTDFQKEYLSFYKSLKDYYLKLKERISNLKIAYQGYNYRFVADNIEKIGLGLNSERFIFLGFNALTPSEEKIINHFLKNLKSEIIWDIDKYYFENKNQEAGFFFRKLKNKGLINNNSLFIENNFAELAKNIDLIGVPMKIGQAKVLPEIINEIYEKEKNLESTAIVLCDENLLIPVINSLPADIGKFNVTMGFPLRQTTIFDLFDSIFLLHENQSRFTNINNHFRTIFYIDLLKILKHNYFKIAFDTQNIIDKISNTNKTFYNYNDILALFSENGFVDKNLLEIFNTQNTTKQLIINIFNLIDYLKGNEVLMKYDLNNEFLFGFSELFHQIINNVDLDASYINVKVLRKLFKSQANTETLSFYGEPLSGLQIMGVLETRLLDFKNVILLSVNEGIIPKSNKNNSLIPLSIKNKFGIAAIIEKDAVFAYHFYRLIQRAGNIKILYNTEPDEFSGGDKSRFIYQLKYELPKINSNIVIRERLVNITSYKSENINGIIIEKNDEIIEKIFLLANKGFSATLLNTYINCKLKFYFKYIVNLDVPDTIEENIMDNTKGNIIHDTLKELYYPFVGKTISVRDIDEISNKLALTLNKAFDKLYSGGTIDYGLNFLIYELIKSWIKKLLYNEKTSIKKLENENKFLKILFLEQEILNNLNLIIENKEITVNLKGNIDRIDLIDGTLRIIDYKSGSINKENVQVSDIEKVTEDKKYSYAFQLLFYYLLLNKQFPELKKYNWEAGIISLIKPSEGLISLKINKQEVDHNNIVEFENLLVSLISEIFDKKLPFTQTSNEDNCKYCEYSEICNRLI
jgi:CRISPR/Cas system-associated exonuclease Cas4 (RecB family)